MVFSCNNENESWGSLFIEYDNRSKTSFLFAINDDEKSKREKNFDISQSCDPLFTISKKALNVLKSILINNGEILEIKSPARFYFFHCTNIIDALIEYLSEIVWLDKGKGWISSIDKFVLYKNKLQSHEIFRIPNANLRYTFFGERFKDLVLKNNLRGIHFNRCEQQLRIAYLQNNKYDKVLSYIKDENNDEESLIIDLFEYYNDDITKIIRFGFWEERSNILPVREFDFSYTEAKS